MSKFNNHKHLVDQFKTDLQGKDIIREGSNLSATDSSTVISLLTIQYSMILDSIAEFDISFSDIETNVSNDLLYVDIMTYIRHCEELAHSFRNSDFQGKTLPKISSDFDKCFEAVYTNFEQSILQFLYAERVLVSTISSSSFNTDILPSNIDGFILSDPDYAQIVTYRSRHSINIAYTLYNIAFNQFIAKYRNMLTLLSYPTRLTLKDIDLTEESISAFYKTQQRLMAHDFSDHGQLISRVRRHITRWCRISDKDKFIDRMVNGFKHGVGSVADGTRTMSHNDKIDLMYYPDEFLYQMSLFGDLSQYSLFKEFMDCLPKVDNSDKWKSSSAEMIFVPKSYKAFRTISKESSTNQFLQQGLLAAIDGIVKDNSELRSIIKRDDQTQNRAMAVLGSIDNDYCTIDLSAASDSVSWKLVKELFKNTDILPFLEASRASFVTLPNGDGLIPATFAGMGSAVTFILECIVFAAIAKESLIEVSRTTGDETWRLLPQPLSVYGDDIIVPQIGVESLRTNLISLGFLPNDDKSFYNDEYFRESCGVEAYFGFDVTPLRISRKFYDNYDMFVRDSIEYYYDDKTNRVKSVKGFKGERYFKLVDMINELYYHGYTSTSRYILKHTVSNVPISMSNKILYTDNRDDSSKIYHMSPKDLSSPVLYDLNGEEVDSGIRAVRGWAIDTSITHQRVVSDPCEYLLKEIMRSQCDIYDKFYLFNSLRKRPTLSTRSDRAERQFLDMMFKGVSANKSEKPYPILRVKSLYSPHRGE
nr:MAG: putative RNA polymerase [Eriocheir sinensis blumevirus 1]